MRDTTKRSALLAATEAAGVAADVRVLDVTQEDSARTCVDAILQTGRPTDALVNNAGTGLVGTLESTPAWAAAAAARRRDRVVHCVCIAPHAMFRHAAGNVGPRDELAV
jgi:short-subunit dehydrogenase